MELFDLVDQNDNVIGITDKITAHKNKQAHRMVAVYVFNEQGELYVQPHKVSNGRLDHSIGGHVRKGEDYVTAARREAREELGICQPLEHLLTFYSIERRFLHMIGLFACVAEPNWRFVPNDEVEELYTMKLSDIIEQMQAYPEKFTGGFINTMQQYRKIKKL